MLVIMFYDSNKVYFLLMWPNNNDTLFGVTQPACLFFLPHPKVFYRWFSKDTKSSIYSFKISMYILNILLSET